MLRPMSTKWRNATLVAAGIVIGLSLSLARGVREASASHVVEGGALKMTFQWR